MIAQHGANRGEHEALGDQLPHESTASAAECGAHSELAFPQDGAREQRGWRRSRTR